MGDETIAALKAVVGEKGYLAGDDIGPGYYTDPRGQGDVRPPFVLRPASTDEVSKIMQICHAAGRPVVAQGGMTGLVSGARPAQGEIPISFTRMNQIEELDPQTSSMTVQCGVPLQTIQEQADLHDLFFPLDLGARGSCTIGGNLSTNAGGNRVIRYGMTRDLVLGVEAVLADGTVVNGLNKFIKNNTGYDVKQYFIGSEGTLGLITRATLRLHRKPRSQAVAFCGAAGFDEVVAFMHHMQSAVGGNLSAFEVIWQSTYQLIVDEVPGIKAPLSGEYPYYILTEILGGDQVRDQENFEATLSDALESGLIADAVVSQSEAEIADLWKVRDGMAEGMGGQQPAVAFDISLSITDMEFFAAELNKRLAAAFDDPRHFIGGHLGDGNLHLVVKADGVTPQPRDQIEGLVYGLVGELNGSISAEHGIGMMKREYLPQSKSPAELALMKTLKMSMDPKGLLNPGRIFELGSSRAS